MCGKSNMAADSSKGLLLKIAFSTVFGLAALFCCSELVLCSVFGSDLCYFYDFQLRYNEARCILSGVDPFLVWNGTVAHAEYVPFKIDFVAAHNYIHAYPPWEYSLFLPLALLPKTVALGVYLAIEASACFCMFYCAYRTFSGRGGSFAGIVGLAIAFLTCYAVFDCLIFGNYGILIAAAIFLMAHFLQKGRQFAAGLCWAFMMVKPQIGLLFAVPVLIGRRYRVLAVAVSACLLTSVLPAVLCGRSPVSMIMSVLDYGRDYNVGGFVHNVFFDPSWVPGLDLSPAVGLGCNVAIGIGLCVYLSFRFRNYDDWTLRLLPASVLCILWFVSRPHDGCVYLFSFVSLGLLIFDRVQSREVLAGLVSPILICLVFQRIGLPMALGLGQTLMISGLTMSLPLLLTWGLRRMPWWLFPVAVATLLSLLQVSAVFVALIYLVSVCVYTRCIEISAEEIC